MGLYERIKKLCFERQITVKSLEEKLGYGNGTMRRWDNNIPSVDKLQKVADYFDVSVDFLLGRTDKKNYYEPTEKENNNNLTSEYFAIQRKSKNLSKRDQERLLKIMEATFDDIDNGDFEEDDDDDL